MRSEFLRGQYTVGLSPVISTCGYPTLDTCAWRLCPACDIDYVGFDWPAPLSLLDLANPTAPAPSRLGVFGSEIRQPIANPEALLAL